MSDTFNPNLFIPRKDSVGRAIGGSCDAAVDPQHLNSALRTNWLAIQRWANQGLFSASMTQSTRQPLTGNSGAPEQLTNWSSLWSANNAVSTALSRFSIPGTGVYLATVETDFQTTSTTTTADLMGTQILASSSAATPFSAESDITASFPWQNSGFFQVTFLFKVTTTPCYVTAGSFVATPSTSLAGASVQSQQFSLVRIGAIPSNVQ